MLRCSDSPWPPRTSSSSDLALWSGQGPPCHCGECGGCWLFEGQVPGCRASAELHAWSSRFAESSPAPALLSYSSASFSSSSSSSPSRGSDPSPGSCRPRVSRSSACSGPMPQHRGSGRTRNQPSVPRATPQPGNLPCPHPEQPVQVASVALGGREAADPPPPLGMARGVVALPSRHAAADLHFVWEVAAGAGKDAATTLQLPACGKSCSPSRPGPCGHLLSTPSLAALLRAQQCWAPTRARCLFCAAFTCFGFECLEERMDGAGMGVGLFCSRDEEQDPSSMFLYLLPVN